MNEFKKFILRGNLVDLAVGFTVGAAFTSVAKSLVEDIIMPPMAALLGNVNVSSLQIVLKSGREGQIAIRYGEFINEIIALLIVALAMFVLVKLVNSLEDRLEGAKEDKKNEPANKKCPYCYSTIAFKATRCSACTSKLVAS